MKRSSILAGITGLLSLSIFGATAKMASTPSKETVAASSTYTKVKSSDELVDGSKIIIVNDNSKVAMSTAQNSSNRGQVSVEFSNDSIVPSNDVQIITLEASESYWAFNVGTGYLYAASSSKNSLKTQKSIDANARWSISFSSDGSTTVKAQGSSTRNLLKYNSNNNNGLFSCYASGQQPIWIYKEAAAKILSKIEIVGEAKKKSYIESESFDPTGLTITATYDDESTSNITSKVTWSPSPLSAGDTSVTATYEEGGKSFTATYEGITVSKLVIEKIVISGNIEKTDYRLTDEWDATGIDVSVTLGNSIEYTGSFDWNFSPKSPNDMGSIKNGELKVWVNIGEVVSNELVFNVNVTNIISLTKTIKDIAAENNWSTSTKYTKANFDENVVASISSESISGKYYSSDYSWRLYQSEKTNSLTLTALNGYEFALVNIGTKSNISMSLNGNSAVTNKDYQVNGTKIVISATSTNLQITSIKLEYKEIDYTEKLNTWISSYLHLEDEDYQGAGTGLCLSNGTYKKAKEALLSLEDSYPGVMEKFKENNDFAEAKARYENWALACNDSNAYAKTTKSSANALPSNLGDISTTLILVTFLMCLSLGASSLFFIRRRHN